MFTLRQKINKVSGGGRLVLASIFGLSVAFSSDLGAYHSDYYQALASRNQLLNVNDNIINRQYRIEKKCAESDVVNTKDSHSFVIFNGGRHKFDKGTSEIYDKSDNLGFILGYEKSCNENLTLGAFAGYSNTDYKQDGAVRQYIPSNDLSNIDSFSDNGNVRSGVFGVFGRYATERLAISSVLSGSSSHYDFDWYVRNIQFLQAGNKTGYSICWTGDVRYNVSKNEKFSFGPLVAMSYCYVEQGACMFFMVDSGLNLKAQHRKTLLGEVGVYGIYNSCIKNMPVRAHCKVTFAGIMKKPDDATNGIANFGGAVVLNATREPSSYINIKLGVTSAVSDSIDINADVKGSFANDYHDIMGAIGMTYNF